MSEGYAQMVRQSPIPYLIKQFFFIGLLLSFETSFGQQAFKDPLDYPADQQTSVTNRTLMAITKAGENYIAVGSRGLIIRSSDKGKTWSQTNVPVQSDLLSVSFSTELDGWTVGHGGVILNTNDGGKTWSKQLDGRLAEKSFKKYYSAPINNEAFKAAARLCELNFKAGPSLPYLDVLFESTEVGYVVGSFGMLAVTDNGGETWTPWMDRIDNKAELNLNSIRKIGEQVYIAGEKGMVYILDRSEKYFRAVATGYTGSFFGIVGNKKTLLAFGLKGVVFKSFDKGETWSQVQTQIESTLTSAEVDLGTHQFILTNTAGNLIIGDAEGSKFKLLTPNNLVRLTDIVLEGNEVIATAVEGINIERLPN